MPDSNLSKLDSIRIKIRRLTKSPSTSQISTEDIDSYINSFILYDMPAEISLNSLKEVFRFYTTPNVSSYSTNTIDVDDPLYNFKNKHTLASNTVFISGSQCYWTDSRADFYGQYPRTITEQSIGTGDGVTVSFAGVIDTYPVLENTIVIASTDLNDLPIKLYDNGTGDFDGDGDGLMEYVTGAYGVTFNSAPGLGKDIYLNSNAYATGKPSTVLYFNDIFELRPVPDKSYTVEIEVFSRPTELIDSAALPELSQWWEYIAFGAAQKILVDRGDFETASVLEVEIEKKRDSVLYKTIIQNTIKEGYGL